MARRKAHEEHENHERWLVSYADFITLLFAFFVVMYSVSAINEGKFRVLSDALVSAFHAPPKSLDPIQIGRPSKSPVLSQLEVRSSPNFLITPRRVIRSTRDDGSKSDETDDKVDSGSGNDALDKISEDIELAMAHLIELGLIHIRRNELWLEIEIKSNVLFKSGSAVIKRQSVPTLTEIGQILSRFPNLIKVEGFTDNQPIKSTVYPSNWELSAARAASVVRLFELSDVNTERLRAVGYGKNRPVASNTTEEGRARNRRVVVIIMADKDVARMTNHKPALTINRNTKPADMKTLASSGIIEQEKVPVQDIAKVDGLAIFRGTVFEEPPVKAAPEPVEPEQQDASMFMVIAPPIRLFSPITLPSVDLAKREK